MRLHKCKILGAHTASHVVTKDFDSTAARGT